MAVVPLSDASRKPTRPPLATVLIVVANIVVFGLELVNGNEFVLRWSVIPAQIAGGASLDHTPDLYVYAWRLGAHRLRPGLSVSVSVDERETDDRS